MANAIRDKINSGFQLLIFDTYAKLTQLTHGRSDTVYYVKADENHNPAIPVSYTWDGTAWAILSQVAEDLQFFDDKTKFPTTGNVDDLYYSNANNYVYEWQDTANNYVFICQASSILIQLISGIVVKYFHASTPPAGINVNSIYKIGFNMRSTYLECGSLRFAIDVNQIITRFIPIDGRQWADIYGDYTPPAVPTIDQTKTDYMHSAMYDANGDGRVDVASDSLKFGGKTPAYYDSRFNNLIKVSPTTPSDLTGTLFWCKKML